MTSYRCSLFFVFLFLLPWQLWAASPVLPEKAPGYVVDLADVLSVNERQLLTKIFKYLETQTTIQCVVLTIPTLDGEDISSFSLHTAEQWKIGQKGQDNGLLFVLVLQDRKYRFDVGYGLESVLPDGLLGSIGRQMLVPHFRQGEYGEGIVAAISEIVRILSETYEANLNTENLLPQSVQKSSRTGFSSFFLFLFLFALLLIIYSRTVNKKKIGGGKEKIGIGAESSPGFFPGGGWGGGTGGFGGFSGGGGGFGGGGASGSW